MVHIVEVDPSSLEAIAAEPETSMQSDHARPVPLLAPWLTLQFTIAKPGGEQFNQPWGISRLSSGCLCIAERAGPRLVHSLAPAHDHMDASAFNAVDLDSTLFDDFQDILCDLDNTVWIAQMGSHRVHRVSLAGETLATIGGIGSEELTYPRALAIQQRRAGASSVPGFGPRLPEELLFVADSGNGRIMVYDTETLAHVRTLGVRCDPHSDSFVEGELSLPLGICAHNGEVYVVDGHTHRISVFRASSGQFVRCIGERGSDPGQFQTPFAACVVRGMLLVTEATRVQVLTLDGQPRYVLEIPGAENLAGLTLGDETGESVCICDTSRGCVYSVSIEWPDEGDRFAGEMNE